MRSHILPPVRAIVLRNVCMLTGIFLRIQICSCDVTSSTYYKHENTRLTAVYDQIPTVTDIVCCSKCHYDSSCNSVSYNPGTKECHLSTTKLMNTDSATENNEEWDTFSLTKPSCKNYLVDGPKGVKDSQLSESNYLCKHTDCTRYGAPPDGHKAKYARLNKTGWYTTGWWPNSNNPGEYVQVDFLYVRTISAIALQGHPTSGYVTSFKVLTSKDCWSFTIISDHTGNDKLFEGNKSYGNGIVIRDLPGITNARCVRIIPVDWERERRLRFDVIGC